MVVAVAACYGSDSSLVTGEWNYWIYGDYVSGNQLSMRFWYSAFLWLFFSGIGAGSKRGILFKGGVAIEALKDVKAIVMDKTGTITKGNFVVQQVVSLKRLTQKQILSQSLRTASSLSSTHPIGTSIVSAAREKNLELSSPKEAEEISGKGFVPCSRKEPCCAEARTSGKIRSGCQRISVGSVWHRSADSGRWRTEGYLVVADAIKPEAGASVKRMKSQNLITAMLTGDARTMRWRLQRDRIDEVHAASAEDKLSHLKQIRKKHGSVMFVGDGINDAPVLAGADVGAAMGTGRMPRSRRRMWYS